MLHAPNSLVGLHKTVSILSFFWFFHKQFFYCISQFFPSILDRISFFCTYSYVLIFVWREKLDFFFNKKILKAPLNGTFEGIGISNDDLSENKILKTHLTCLPLSAFKKLSINDNVCVCVCVGEFNRCLFPFWMHVLITSHSYRMYIMCQVHFVPYFINLLRLINTKYFCVPL